MRVPLNVEPPQFVTIFAGIVDTHTWTGRDVRGREPPVFEPEYFALQVLRVQPLIDLHGAA
jgi:hypothetical protein